MESQYATELQNILLSWDYWHLERLSRDNKGPIDTLPNVPQKFSTVEVRLRRGKNGWVQRMCHEHVCVH